MKIFDPALNYFSCAFMSGHQTGQRQINRRLDPAVSTAAREFLGRLAQLPVTNACPSLKRLATFIVETCFSATHQGTELCFAAP
jgi:hypothetical protein